ncbi:hypothetical protein LTR36_005720 [Oleoguttula mirabilis]|uniref:Uncharacterized protein n=1 Tax=Oleoguttula mirabilis TaxID=1507867 RepID=A0AAV9JFA3_9PEZI|nr:hypothetical protein LTR36_005720 [Oleoguttula mirabilis]
MSAVGGAFIGHVVKRSMQAAQDHFSGPSQEMIDQLNHDAELYEKAGPEMELNPRELLPVLITGLIALVLIASIRYTIGEVMASLAMIESPSSTAIIEPKGAPPPYADGPDAPLNEKEPLMPAEADADADVEITVINHKHITSKVVNTIGLLHRIGGFRARWRGLGLSVLYHMLHAGATNLLASFLGFSIFGNAVIYIFVSIGLARLHMLWTHSMIAHPSEKSIFRRFVPRKQCKALLLPSLVFATAQQATFLLPLSVAFALKLDNIDHGEMMHAAHNQDCAKIMLTGLRFLAVPATALFVALAVLLPAAVTLTRIEATLLPEDEQTIVPFDRAAIMGDIDTTSRGGCRALFVQAWRSFDRSARLRLVKVYVKMVFAQITIVFIAAHLMVAELYLIGGERLAIFAKSAIAQVKLMAIEAHKQAEQGAVAN